MTAADDSAMLAAPPPPKIAQSRNRASFLSRFPYWHDITLVLLLLGLLIFAHFTDRTFLNPSVQRDLSTHVWELALLALPMTLIIITAGIDLSVGSTMALSAVVLGLAFEHRVPIALACLFALAAATLCG